MKILVIAWYFPPTNTIAAIRIGAMCKYLFGSGHEVRVLTVADPPLPQTYPVEIPPELICYTPWTDVSARPTRLIQWVKSLSHGYSGALRAEPGETGTLSGATAPEPASGDTSDSPFGRGLSGWLKASLWGAVNWPDKNAGWLPHALEGGRAMLAAWRPDLLYVSGPPFTTFLIGDRLSRRFRVPWVAEFRDRWSDDPYYPPPTWLRARERWTEQRVVARTAGIVTVSQPWAETYRRRYAKPTKVIYNGFDECLLSAGPEQCAGSPDPALRIVYTGGIYPGRRDPSPLFQAIRLLPDFETAVRVQFYGTDPRLVMPLADRHGVTKVTAVHPAVDHAEAVRQQMAADVLLLLQWNDPREQGNVPGKFFEYLGARRPILVLGLEDGVPATILRERNAGLCLNDPEAIAAKLREWTASKAQRGRIPALPEAAREGYCRLDQNRELQAFLEELLATVATCTGQSGSPALPA